MPDESESVAVILARMEVKLDHALTQTGDHEARIRVLEKKIWGVAGLVSALSAGGAGAMVKILGG